MKSHFCQDSTISCCIPVFCHEGAPCANPLTHGAPPLLSATFLSPANDTI